MPNRDLNNNRMQRKGVTFFTALNLFQLCLTLKYASRGNWVDPAHSSQQTETYILKSRRKTLGTKERKTEKCICGAYLVLTVFPLRTVAKQLFFVKKVLHSWRITLSSSDKNKEYIRQHMLVVTNIRNHLGFNQTDWQMSKFLSLWI
jgi:hypothetical protein